MDVKIANCVECVYLLLLKLVV